MILTEVGLIFRILSEDIISFLIRASGWCSVVGGMLFCVAFACYPRVYKVFLGDKQIFDSTLISGVKKNVSGCLPCFSLPMGWQLVLGVPHLSPKGSWTRLQPPVTPLRDEEGKDRWTKCRQGCFMMYDSWLGDSGQRASCVCLGC